MIVAGVWTGVGFSNLKNCRIRIEKFWSRSLKKWLKEVLGLGAEGQDFVFVVDFNLTFSFLVVEVEGCRHRFCSAER